MRTVAAVAFVVILVVAAIQTGSATPAFKMVSPALYANGSQRVECNVVNTDNVPHVVTILIFDNTGTQVSGNPPLTAPAHGSAGLNFPGGGLNHCEVTADTRTDALRGSIDVLDTVFGTIVTALPMY